jgi:hypothetical protein
MLDTVIVLLCQNNMLEIEKEFIDVCTVQYLIVMKQAGDEEF